MTAQTGEPQKRGILEEKDRENIAAGGILGLFLPLSRLSVAKNDLIWHVSEKSLFVKSYCLSDGLSVSEWRK